MSDDRAARAAAIRARMDESRAARIRAWRELYSVEAFRPSFPRRMPLTDYPMRGPSGSLVTHCVVPCPVDSDGGRLVRYVCEDGTTWLEARPHNFHELKVNL